MAGAMKRRLFPLLLLLAACSEDPTTGYLSGIGDPVRGAALVAPSRLGDTARLAGDPVAAARGVILLEFLDLSFRTDPLYMHDVSPSNVQTIRRGRFAADAAAMLDLVDRYDVGALVVGLPLALDGSEGPRCQSVRQFAANLLEIRDLPVAFQDERLSTAAVERVLIDDADMSRRRRAEVVDRAAAAYILQGALDRLKNL
jgi:putative Holliday junction resolvase